MAKNWVGTLTEDEKYVLNFMKGEERIMNKDGLFGYYEITNFLSDMQSFNIIGMPDLQQYLIAYQLNREDISISYFDIAFQLQKLFAQINMKRIEAVKKYITTLDNLFERGINSSDTVYRYMSRPFNSNIIENFTSWSLIPLDKACSTKECYLYVTKLPKKLKALYVENEGTDPNLKMFSYYQFYEYEYILPRNIEFKELKREEFFIPNRFYDSKNEVVSNTKDIKIIVIHIKLTKKHKNEFPPLLNRIMIRSYMN